MLLASATVVLLAAAVIVVSGWHALTAAHEVSRARAGLSAAQSASATLDDITRAASRSTALLDHAAHHLDSPSVGLVAAVPLLGRSYTAERDVVAAARTALDGVSLAAQSAPRLRSEDGRFDPVALRSLAGRLQEASARSRRTYATLRAASTGLTPPQVSAGVRDARRQLGPVVAGLHKAALGAQAAAGLLGADGPRHVLIGLENNAELRGTGGYVSTFATGVIAHGQLSLEPFQDVAQVQDPPDAARRVPAPAAYHQDYGPFLADTTLFQNWTMSPDVPTAAKVGAEAAGALLGTTPDVVILIDVPALASIASLTGNGLVLPDGDRVSAADLPRALMVDSYAQAGSSPAAQSDRRVALRQAAGAAATRLLASNIPTADAVRALGRLAAGRHLALWSSRPQEERLLKEAGLAGAVDPGQADMALISVNNNNANKLDYYVDRTVDVHAMVGPESATVVQRVTLTNNAPDGLVPYVAGTASPGTVAERIEFTLPTTARVTDVTAQTVPQGGAVRTGPDRTRVIGYATIPRGASATMTVRYTVPTAGTYRLNLLPQALAHDATLTVRVRPAPGTDFASASGAELKGGDVRLSGPWRDSQQIVVRLRSDSFWQRVKNFWNSPVHLGG